MFWGAVSELTLAWVVSTRSWWLKQVETWVNRLKDPQERITSGLTVILHTTSKAVCSEDQMVPSQSVVHTPSPVHYHCSSCQYQHYTLN